MYTPIPIDREKLPLMGVPFPDLATLIHIQRYKGLGEGAMPPMNYDQLFDTTMDPQNRKMLKDPYNFDFLGLADDAHEREVENALVRHISQFLLKLGVGFSFVGRQYRLEVTGEEFFIPYFELQNGRGGVSIRVCVRANL